MYQLPPIPAKKRKARKKYAKPESVKELERLKNEQDRVKHPNVDPKYLAPYVYRDDTANGLTACIVTYITLRGGFASRVNNGGTWRKDLGKYTPSGAKRGIPDIIATYKGVSLMVEVKIGRDKMSVFQERVKAEHEAAGGRWFTAHDFTAFKSWFDAI